MDELDTIVLTDEIKVQLRAEQVRLVKVIEALIKLDASKEWQVLKEEVFDKSRQAIERQLMNESMAIEVKDPKIYRLQGEYAWAKQFCDTNRFVETLKKQLEEIKRKLK